MPAGTKTALPMTGTATRRAVTLYMIDASGDKWSQKLIVAFGATLAAINAWIVFYQAVSQASVYAVTDEWLWAGAEDVAQAMAGPRFGKENGVNLGFLNGDTRDYFGLRLIAPIEDVMSGNADIPLPGQADMALLITNTETLLAPAGYVFKSAQYTTRKERANNPRVAG